MTVLPVQSTTLESLGWVAEVDQPVQVFETGVQPYFFAIADVSGDGNLDLAVVDSCGSYVTILLGNGDGTFSPRQDVLSNAGCSARNTSHRRMQWRFLDRDSVDSECGAGHLSTGGHRDSWKCQGNADVDFDRRVVASLLLK